MSNLFMCPCPRCGGKGKVPLAKSAAAVLDVLRAANGTPLLSSAIAPQVGLSHSQTDNRLVQLRDAGLVIQLPRTARGFEWLPRETET